DRVDRDARAADLAARQRVVGVEAQLGGQVERHGEAGLAAVEQQPEAPVGLLRRREAGVLAHRPRPLAVAVRPHAARVRVVGGGRPLAGRVRGAIDGLDGDARLRQALAIGCSHARRIEEPRLPGSLSSTRQHGAPRLQRDASLRDSPRGRVERGGPRFNPPGHKADTLGRMRITVRLFAALRERAGWSKRELDLPDGAVVADVWPALDLGDEPPGLAYARNREYADRDTAVAAGDEVAVIPPVSGGAFAIGSDPLDLDAVVAQVADPAAGAIATFVGTTRRHSRGRTVVHLEYDAYPEMAESEMARIADDVKARHDVLHVAMAHRTGHVPIGEASVIIAVSAAHRGPAMDACREAIDTLKQTVPVWKKEIFEGGEEWIGREGT